MMEFVNRQGKTTEAAGEETNGNLISSVKRNRGNVVFFARSSADYGEREGRQASVQTFNVLSLPVQSEDEALARAMAASLADEPPDEASSHTQTSHSPPANTSYALLTCSSVYIFITCISSSCQV